ncbi:MAG: TlpA family protein disulfide reductase [Candidatus Aminicenantes bacterium]|nr:TlpA family protein disulfide reductase [Candidatus Aminicenantes bacterium]
MKPLRTAVMTAAALMLGGAIVLSFAPAPAPQAGSLPAPDFTLTDLSGKTIKLSDYKGKVLFLNFWATWCPPCRAEIPDFVEAYAQEKANGLEILGISLDTNGKAGVAAFVEKYKINYPVILESRRNTERLINDYQPGQYIPTTIIIDKSGRIRHKEVGAIDKETLLKHFQRYSAE